MLLAASLPAWAQTAPEKIDPEWGDKLVALAQVGFMGVAIGVFLLAAFVLVWGKRDTEQQAKTVRQYLMYAFLSLVVAAGVEVWKTRNYGTVIVWFSPKFSDDLPQPVIRNGGFVGQQGQPIDISHDRTLQIVLDDALDKIKSLAVSNKDLAAANQTQRKVVLQLTSQSPLSQAGGE
jgi:hypothetical protein